MRLIELAITAFCAILGFGALFVGNYIEGILLWLLPLAYFLFVSVRKSRKKAAEIQAKLKEESDAFWAKERDLREKSKQQYAFDRWGPLDPQKTYASEQTAHDRYRARQQEAYDRHRAAQLQQMNMMHQNSIQQAAAQQQPAQQSNVNSLFGFSDPRSTFSAQQSSRRDDTFDAMTNAALLYNMVNQPSDVHASTASPGGPARTDAPLQEPVKVDPIQFHSFVNSSSESSSSSSSSSYSSDTSSDSFGGSDTSSDSF